MSCYQPFFNKKTLFPSVEINWSQDNKVFVLQNYILSAAKTQKSSITHLQFQVRPEKNFIPSLYQHERNYSKWGIAFKIKKFRFLFSRNLSLFYAHQHATAAVAFSFPDKGGIYGGTSILHLGQMWIISDFPISPDLFYCRSLKEIAEMNCYNSYSGKVKANGFLV